MTSLAITSFLGRHLLHEVSSLVQPHMRFYMLQDFW